MWYPKIPQRFGDGPLPGGGYPHPRVPPVEAVGPVQTGVWYSPDLVWLAFDGAVSTSSGTRWMGRAELADRMAGVGLQCVPLVGQGHRQKLGELTLDFPTLVPGTLGLPELPGNRAEGYVLKPAGSWDTGERGPRPVLKVKHPDFAEDARYTGARPFVPPPGGVTGVPAWLLAAAVERLTPPRVDAARSKLGPAADTAALAAEVVADLLADLDDDLGGLPEPDHERLAVSLTPAARTLATLQDH